MSSAIRSTVYDENKLRVVLSGQPYLMENKVRVVLSGQPYLMENKLRVLISPLFRTQW